MSGIGSLLGSPIGQGVMGGIGPAIDSGINLATEMLVNRPTRLATTAGLFDVYHNRLIPQLGEAAQGALDDQRAAAAGYNTDAWNLIHQQRRDYNTQYAVAPQVDARLTALLGFNPAQGADPTTRDPRNALGRYNTIHDEMYRGIDDVNTSMNTALDEAVDARSQQTAQAAAQAANFQKDQQADLATKASLGQLTEGQQATMSMQAADIGARFLGDKSMDAQVAYEQNRQQIRSSYTNLRESVRTAMGGMLTQAGSDIGRETEFISNLSSGAAQFDASIQSHFNDAERAITDSYFNTLMNIGQNRFQMATMVSQFAANGYNTIAGALNNTQIAPTALPQVTPIFQSFNSGFSQARQERAANRAADQGGFF